MLTYFLGYAQQSLISIGETVRVDTGGTQRLNLRKAPGVNQEIVARLENGTTMQVVGGPEYADGFEWWEIEGSPGQGWAVGQFMKVIEGDEEDVTAVDERANESVLTSGAVADAFGFSGCYFKERPKFPYFYIDIAVSYEQVKQTSDLLARAGYNSTAHQNRPSTDALEALPKDEIFFFFGHGANHVLQFQDDNCNYSHIFSAQVSKIKAQNLKLALLLGCKTAENFEAPDNILRAFLNAGASKAIGFRDDVPGFFIDHWNKSFWNYAVIDGMEVGDAAGKAAQENILGAYWISPSSLEVRGNKDVYLKPLEGGEKEESFDWSQIGQIFNQWLDQRLEQWNEAMQARWDDLLQNLEQRLAEILERELENLTKRAQEALLEYLYQCLAAPFGAFVLLGFALLRRRNKASAK